jgi:hypothetical protein
MASWFNFWESKGISQEITGPEIVENTNPVISMLGIIIPKTVLN